MRWLLLAPILTACAGGSSHVDVKLRTLGPGCDAVIDYVREAAIQRMNAAVDDAEQRYFANQGCWYGGEDDAGGSPPNTTGGGQPSPTPPEGPTTGTGTNNQVDGVDEADFVKTDGQYLYIVENGALRIFDAWPANQTHQVSETPIAGTPKKLLLSGDRLVVYTAIDPAGGSGAGSGRECTYGYSCSFSGDGSATKLVQFDVSNRAAPVQTRTIDLSGSLIAGRMIGSAVHTVVSQSAMAVPSVPSMPQELCNGETWSVRQAKLAFARLREANEAVIEEAAIDPNNFPALTDSANALAGTAACTGFYGSAIADGAAFTSVVSFDLDTTAAPNDATIVSQPGAVFAATDALYIAVPNTSPYGADPSVERSAIHRFAISGEPSSTAYQASGYVRGHVLSQFAMDEYQGNLRVATTSGFVPSEDVISQITVLHRTADRLDTLGFVGGIGPHEDIRAVRFDGDKGFVVTFKKTDPLFVFDLANPAHPRQLGELMIPGFSTYIHMLDATHLLTIGYDADDHDSFAYFDGVMLQIFDVSDPAHPTKLHDHVIGTRGSSSEALTNHLAFTWYPEKSLLALPMTICEGGGDGTFGQNLTFSGLLVYDATIASGFAEHGRVSATLDPSVSCGNWWTEASSVVKRSLFLDNYVYAISGSELIVRDSNALGTPLVSLPL